MNYQRITVVLDCDGVLANLSSPFDEFLASHFQKPPEYKAPQQYFLADSLDITKEEEYALVDAFYRSSFFGKIQPYEGARKMVRHLSYDFDLAVATARPMWLAQQTSAWNDKHFHPLQIPVHHTGEYYRDGAPFASKADVCRHLNSPLIVEDSPFNALACAQQGISVILVNHTYNGDVKHGLIARVDSLDDVSKITKKILKPRNS